MSKFEGLLSVKGGQGIKETKKTPPEPVSMPKKGKLKPPGKRSDPNYTQITAYILKDTHEDVMRRIYKRQEFSELVGELLTDWLKKNK